MMNVEMHTYIRMCINGRFFMRKKGKMNVKTYARRTITNMTWHNSLHKVDVLVLKKTDNLESGQDKFT